MAYGIGRRNDFGERGVRHDGDRASYSLDPSATLSFDAYTSREVSILR